jgi:hypothetical protein
MLVIVGLEPRSASAHEYIRNGSFESGTDAWTLLSDGSSFDTNADSVSPIDGSSRARIALGQPTFRLNQSIADVPPGTYNVQMSVRVESTSAIVKLDVLADPSWAPTFSPVTFVPEPGVWQRVDATLTMPGSSWVSIRLFGTGVAGDIIYVDDVHFSGAPPATMTPTNTHTATATPIPPTPTRTPRPTSTPKRQATPTVPPATLSIASGRINNPGFEDVVNGLPSSWQKYGGSLSSATTPIRSGGRAARLESTTDSTKWLFQTVAITGGASYAFGAWLWHDDPNTASAFLRVSWYASPDGSGEAIATADSLTRLDAPLDSWRYLTTGGITAPPEAQSAKVRILLQPLGSARAALVVDDASFATADPATSAPPSHVLADDEATTAGSSVSPRHTAADTGRTAASTLPLASGAAKLVINEVMYDSLESPDAEGEWVEIFNAGDAPISTAGWLLADNRTVDRLPDVTLVPGAFAVIVASDRLYQKMTEADITVLRVGGQIGNSLNNEGDVLVLIAPSGRFVDAVSWGDSTSALDPSIPDVPAGHSIERRLAGADTDSAADFVDNERPSPGMPYPAIGSASPSRVHGQSSVQVVSGDTSVSTSWLVLLAVSLSTGVLAAALASRAAPFIAQRLRHQ